jgi:hypothetical protein
VCLLRLILVLRPNRIPDWTNWRGQVNVILHPRRERYLVEDGAPHQFSIAETVSETVKGSGG